MDAEEAVQRQWGQPKEGDEPDLETMYPTMPAAEVDDSGAVPLGEAYGLIEAFTVEETCVAPFRMLEDVPCFLRQAWANAWSTTIDNVRAAEQRGDEHGEMIALRWFLILPQLLLRTRARTAPEAKSYLARRFSLFEAQQYGTLLRDWAADAVCVAEEQPREAAASPVPHAVRLCAKGLLSRAAQHLSSPGVGDSANPEVRAQMCRKCPKRAVNIPAEFLNLPGGDLKLDLTESMRQLKRMSGVGIGGLRNEYLRSLVLVSDRSEPVELTEYLGERWVNGRLPA